MQLIEGGGVSQLRRIVKQLGYIKDVDIELRSLCLAQDSGIFYLTGYE